MAFIASLGLLLLGAAAQAAEPTVTAKEPDQVPWNEIEAWALDQPIQPKKDESAAKEPKKPAPEKPAPNKAEANDKKNPAPEPEPKGFEPIKDAGWQRSHPRARRPEPPEALAFRGRIPQYLEANIKEATRLSRWDKALEVYKNTEQYDRALMVLQRELMSDAERLKRDQHFFRWVSGEFWQIGILCRNRPPKQQLDQAYQTWEKLSQKLRGDGIPLPEELKEIEDYYQSSANLKKSLDQLSFQGDLNPDALWELQELYDDRRPVSAVGMVCTLYKLREWFPAYEKTKVGEVQWRLTDQLYEDFKMWEESIPELEAFMQKYPKHRHVVDGVAMWRLAESYRNHGYALPRNKAFEPWRKAVELYNQYGRLYPKATYNQPAPNTQPAKSTRAMRVEELSGRLGSHK